LLDDPGRTGMISRNYLATIASPAALINIKTPAVRDKVKVLGGFAV
jgi:hypothetical protein